VVLGPTGKDFGASTEGQRRSFKEADLKKACAGASIGSEKLLLLNSACSFM
jgi:hypothetical protein